MAFYRRDLVTDQHRQEVRQSLKGLNLVPDETVTRVVEAWAIMWTSSSFERLSDIPASPSLRHSLVDHTNDVVRLGRAIGNTYREIASLAYDDHALDQILYLHDIDKMLLFHRTASGVERTKLSRQMPHGVIAGMLLNEMQFSEQVISVVTTHATDAPFHGLSTEALIMHYADMAAIDYVRLHAGQAPFYSMIRQ